MIDVPNEAEFREYLNDMYGYVNICGIACPASDVLEEIDPVAFDVMYAEFCAEMLEDDNESI